MKAIHHAGVRVTVPAGFSGWWCQRCERAAESIPEEAGSPAKCPHCRKWTAVWVPAAGPDQTFRELSHGPAYERKGVTVERSKELFNHMRAVIENPELNPDLKAIEEDEYYK